ncbi:hypothetical protein OIV83_002999 [Microbotryomycetes sp. JL201]|nr:hypothetical protein OIV83_002999 [Microbotryomycetes sp. JL201]
MSFSWQGVSSFESVPSGHPGPESAHHPSAPTSKPHSHVNSFRQFRSADNVAEFRLSASIPNHIFPSHHSHPNAGSIPAHFSRITHEGVGQFDHTFMRHCRRSRGPRLLPVLIVGGVGVWAYSCVKRDAEDLRNENRALRQAIVTRSNTGEVSTMLTPAAHLQREEPRRRSGWTPWSHGRRASQKPESGPPEDQRFV